MPTHSAGILVYRRRGQTYEVLLVHPGGPFWANKDNGSWSMPKGEPDDGEELLAAAKREFTEETNIAPPPGDYQPLGRATQPSGKIVHAFAIEADVDLEHFKSNTFALVWPPNSGHTQHFPECDKAQWIALDQAVHKLTKGQVAFIERLATYLGLAVSDAQ